ncbi:MAG: phosphoribosyl-ATP pyrophosphohydrolase [Candidatus Thorarchaeota archaeon]|nr:phosphoribosyl-ATP pyrophosphohydrolase [Candidatus Thorarchaeota archaeon]
MPEKLVRDRIPDIIRTTGIEPVVRVASIEELDLLLREKAVEEAKELLLSGDTEEIGDLLEVLHELIKIRGVEWGKIEEIRKDKSNKRGGFANRYVLFQEETET